MGTTPKIRTSNKKSYRSPRVKLQNLRTIEKVTEIIENNKILEWEELGYWDMVLREHKERIEKEEQDKNNRLEKQQNKLWLSCAELKLPTSCKLAIYQPGASYLLAGS